MKLNYKRTICVGFAFFLICAFWQAYDNTVPLILTNKFGMSQAWSGVIMALDNILALFLLPLFGAISDKHTGKRGRRTPFILIGTIVAAIAFISLSLVDDAQLKNLDGAAAIDPPLCASSIRRRRTARSRRPTARPSCSRIPLRRMSLPPSRARSPMPRARPSRTTTTRIMLCPRVRPTPTRRRCSTRVRSSAAGRARRHGHVPLSGRCAHA